MKARKTINETESMDTLPCHHKTGGPLPGHRAHQGRRISAFRSAANRVLALAVLGQAFFGLILIPNAQAMGPDNWIAIGDGITGANGPVIDMVTDETGTVYVAGNFTVIGDVAANRIAKWDGSGWSALGSVMVGTEVSELAVMGGMLFAGGLFSDAGGGEVKNIAKWDGSSWSALGSGVNNWADAMAVDGTDLYVGGLFTTAGGVPAHRIAKWDGASWTSLNFDGGGGVSPYVKYLSIVGSDLYAGGNFTGAGGVPANHVAKWDGTAWSALGSGTSESLPTPIVSGGSIHFADGADYVDSGDPIVGGKVSPLISRYHLGDLPSMEIGSGTVQVHFRTDLNQAKGVAPGRVHRIDRTTDLTGAWETVGYKYATETGGIDFTDEARGFAVYRALPQD